MNPPQAEPKFSKRQFLFGAAAGAVTLQAARMIGASPAAAPTEIPKYRASFSQSGEDLIASYIFGVLGILRPSYIDIGAYDPVEINNTYLFYLNDSRGVLVEPNVDLIPRLKSVRKGDTVLNAGIGVDTTSAVDYYRLSEPSWNTFSKEQVDLIMSQNPERPEPVKLLEVVKMPLININEVFQKEFHGGTPDFFSIDIEGLDLPILQSINFDKHRPKVICVETLITGTKEEKAETGQFLLAKGYVMRGSSFVNAIFVDRTTLNNKG